MGEESTGDKRREWEARPEGHMPHSSSPLLSSPVVENTRKEEKQIRKILLLRLRKIQEKSYWGEFRIKFWREKNMLRSSNAFAVEENLKEKDCT